MFVSRAYMHKRSVVEVAQTQCDYYVNVKHTTMETMSVLPGNKKKTHSTF